MSPLRTSFAKRFFIFYGIIFIAVLLVTDWMLTRVFEKRDFDQLHNSLVHQTLLLRELVTPPFLQGNAETLQALVRDLSNRTKSRITVVDRTGIVKADSSEDLSGLSKMDNHALRPEIAAALTKEMGTSIRYSMTLETRMLYIAMSILKDAQVVGVIRAALPVQQVDQTLASARRPIYLATLLGILVVILVGFFFGNHVNHRIRRITYAAQRYADGDFSEKVPIDGQDELQLLAGTMNAMAQALRFRMEELRGEKEKMAAILQNMSDGVLAVDHMKQVLVANQSAEMMFAIPEGSSHGQNLIEVTRNPQINTLMDRVWKTHSPVSEEILLIGKVKRSLQISAIGIQDPKQEIRGILVFHDITELHRLENIRKEFVANVSHEIRTPLTSLRGFIETLLSGATNDAAATERFLRIMEEDTLRLSRLVDDLLTLNEVEQGFTVLKKEPLDLSAEVRIVLDRFKSQLEGKKIAVENKIASHSQLRVQANPDKFRQVLVNLLDNAIKFNQPAGKIVLDAQNLSKEIEISVEDTGIGIPQDAIDRIFERFFRVDKTRSRELGGTGLGLAIVKHILEAHGGHAACKSQVGKGSTFLVFFPI